MRFLALLLSSVIVEIRAILGVLPLLRRPFWIVWVLCFLPALVGLLPGAFFVVAQFFVLIVIGLAGLFSGFLAKKMRRRKWVAFPDGPAVVPYLPQLITLRQASRIEVSMSVESAESRCPCASNSLPSPPIPPYRPNVPAMC